MFLIVHDGPQKLWEIELPSELVTIGRAPGNTLVLPDREVAERHAQIEPAGHFHVLRDRASDGTYVNGRAVSLEILKPGDTIRIARYALRVVAHPSNPRGGPEAPAGSAEPRRPDAEQGKLLGSVARHIRSGLDDIERRLPLLR